MKKTLFALLSLGLAGSAFSVDFTANKAVEMVPVSHDYVAAATDKDTWEQTEWFDSWFADGGGLSWYTPELYTFAQGDTMEVVVFIHLEGATTNFKRADGFYLCGNTNPLNWLLTSGSVDFGQIPQNDPNYGWITGLGYNVPRTPANLNIDSASRVLWNGATVCGVPLTGRPDCATLN